MYFRVNVSPGPASARNHHPRTPRTTPPSSPTSTPREADAPVLILLHMLNSRRGAYDPLIPDLQAAGYAILNVDMRGHGDSDGTQDWDAIIADMAGWVDWLADSERTGEAGLAFIGGSIGANVALISCAGNDAWPRRGRPVARAGITAASNPRRRWLMAWPSAWLCWSLRRTTRAARPLSARCS